MAQENNDGLLSESELREAVGEATQILAQPVRQYEYSDPNYRGGPRHSSDHDVQAAAIELTTARVLVDELEDRLEEAKIHLLELCAEQREHGIPMEMIAQLSGRDHRSSMYRDLNKLPEMKAKRERRQQIRSQTRRQA